MVYEPKAPDTKIARFSEYGGDGSEAGIHLGLELGLGANYKEKMDDRSKKMKVSMGFTFMQRMELEQQACIFNHIQSGVQVPYPLLYPLWKSVARSTDCGSFPFVRNFGWSWMGSSDPEPGRCKRTDGKKWRCANEALADHKYCEKHLNRGRSRSRKLVESSSFSTTSSASTAGGAFSSSQANTCFPAPQRISLANALPLKPSVSG